MNDIQKEFIQLGETILSIYDTNTKVYYLANPGNFGDALIRKGTIDFFNYIDLNFKEINIDDVSKCSNEKSILIYGGGGAWCNLWNHSPKIVSHVFPFFKNIVVLPSTYELRYYFKNVTFFSRDNYESIEIMPHSIFCPDMAFYLKPNTSEIGNGTGFFFRNDRESNGIIKIPKNNYDLSANGNHFSDIIPFFRQIEKYEKIFTDRLHVAIAACLLGRELHLFPGCYFKNKALYYSTIDRYFLNTYFHEVDDINSIIDQYS